MKWRVPTYFKPREIVVEILETVEPSQEIVDSCMELRKLGYKVALDDFIFNDSNPFSLELMKHADYVKVDILNTSKEKRTSIESKHLQNSYI
ncbi:c-di-GMP-related signal transduction protein [Bacillus pakistanensis]|uniref:C-di-GMP-related signal transduction protein n=1 Tax=Rossellomorea pakistanensis TaxID=992288 RepID=A0ABS2N9E8_9BACI|nr:c-di-GMP-related signal transduction protein [Bacillus pakistanensis]